MSHRERVSWAQLLLEVELGQAEETTVIVYRRHLLQLLSLCPWQQQTLE